MVMSSEQCCQGYTGWKEVAALTVPHSQCTLQGTKRTKKRAIWHLPIYTLWAPDKKPLNRDGRKSRCGSCSACKALRAFLQIFFASERK